MQFRWKGTDRHHAFEFSMLQLLLDKRERVRARGKIPISFAFLFVLNISLVQSTRLCKFPFLVWQPNEFFKNVNPNWWQCIKCHFFYRIIHLVRYVRNDRESFQHFFLGSVQILLSNAHDTHYVSESGESGSKLWFSTFWHSKRFGSLLFGFGWWENQAAVLVIYALEKYL